MPDGWWYLSCNYKDLKFREHKRPAHASSKIGCAFYSYSKISIVWILFVFMLCNLDPSPIGAPLVSPTRENISCAPDHCLTYFEILRFFPQKNTQGWWTKKSWFVIDWLYMELTTLASRPTRIVCNPSLRQENITLWPVTIIGYFLTIIERTADDSIWQSVAGINLKLKIWSAEPPSHHNHLTY